MSVRYVYGEDKRLIDWAEKIIGSGFRDDCKAIGREVNGNLVCAVLFDTFNTNSCCIHVASNGNKRFLTKQYLIHVFAYPFIQCKFDRVTGLVALSNNRAIILNERLGFVREGVMRRGSVNGDDLVIFGMLREECRFLRGQI